MDTKFSFRDFLWVLMAYLRGKMLRQKAYRPQGNAFPSMPGANINRMLTIIDWWGYRPMTTKEMLPLMRAEDRAMAQMVDRGCVPDVKWADLSYVPFADYTDKGISVIWRRNDYGFRACRKH